MTELEKLVRNCPITCGIECGSFELFSAPVSFRISRVSGFMDLKNADALMEFSIDYLQGFVRDFIGRSVIVNSKGNGDSNENTNADGSPNAVEVSESNDVDPESGQEDSEITEDDFLNEDIGAGGIVFEIDTAVLTSQNLVEDTVDSGSGFGKLALFDGQDTERSRSGGAFRRERLLRWRNLQELQRSKQQSSGGESIVKTDEALDVIIMFDGFTIGMNPKRMSELLVLGIDSVDFTRELQQSRINFFSDATVSSATETAEEDLFLESDLGEDGSESNSRFSVVISYLVPIVVIGFALGSLLYHKCYGKGRWISRHRRRRLNAIERAQIGGMTATPMAANNNNSILASISNEEDSSGGYFNFRRHVSTSFHTDEENENRRTKATDQLHNNENENSNIHADKEEGNQSTFARIIGALNINLSFTKSKTSTDEEDNEAEEDYSSESSRSSGDADADEEPKHHDGLSIIRDPLVSPISGDSGNNEATSFDNQEFNAYASVLPPMIVIDNIDGPDVDALTPVAITSNTRTAGSNNGVPDSSLRSSNAQIEELDAFASEFRKQLLRSSTNSTNAQHPSFTGSFHGMYSPSAVNSGPIRMPLFGPNSNDEDEGDDRVIKGIVSEDFEGDDLFSPIPSNITTNEDGDGDENGEDLIPQPERTSSYIASDDEGSSTSPTSKAVELSKEKRIYGTWDGSSSPSRAVPNLDTNMSSSSMPGISHRGTNSDLSLPRIRAVLPPKRPPTPERGISSLRKNANGSIDKNPIGSEQHYRRSSFPKSASFSFTPIARALIGGSSGSVEIEGHRRKSSSDTTPDIRVTKNNSSISALSQDDLVIGSSKSDGSNYNINTTRLEFEAPREGNWGLVLESSSRTGPRIYAVKDYSPLFGLVQKGDKLLEIDGKNVSQSKLTDVTKLLKGKSSSYPYHRSTSTNMPIVVSRSSIPNIDSSAPIASSIAYNNTSSSSKDRHQRHPHYTDYNHKRDNSYGSYGSAGSSGSRVVEDVDDEKNAVYYLDHHHRPQHHSSHSSFDYDSNNEI